MHRPRIALFGCLALSAGVTPLLLVPACYSNEASDSPGDPPADAALGDSPKALGGGPRIAQIAPTTMPDGGVNPLHPPPDASVTINGSSLITIDSFDETHDGKSIGSVYVEDVQRKVNPDGTAVPIPYAGIQLYKPTYDPPNLLLAPGDVIDMYGTYQDYAYSGFASYQTTPEFYEPIVSFLFEYKVPAPVVIQQSDLVNVSPQKDYDKGQRWLSMLVEMDNVTIMGNYTDSHGRVNLYFSPTATNQPSIANQLYDLQVADYPTGTVLKKVIGVTAFFFNFTVAPRTPADMVCDETAKQPKTGLCAKVPVH